MNLYHIWCPIGPCSSYDQRRKWWTGTRERGSCILSNKDVRHVNLSRYICLPCTHVHLHPQFGIIENSHSKFEFKFQVWHAYTREKLWCAHHESSKCKTTRNFPQWDAWIITTSILGKKFRMLTMSHSSVKWQQISHSGTLESLLHIYTRKKVSCAYHLSLHLSRINAWLIL